VAFARNDIRRLLRGGAALPFALRGSLGFGGAVSLLLGDKIYSGLSQAAFQRVVCAALFLCGVPLLFK